MGIQKRIAKVVKASRIRKGDTICIGLHEGAAQQAWAEVTDVRCGGYGTSLVTVNFGEGWENEDSLEPNERVLVLR